ncbi:hypothetical protein HUU39_06610 [candidate division KSB1 bacterium]|nr:hypothetical protein [candidate division KSB1 bacterium]
MVLLWLMLLVASIHELPVSQPPVATLPIAAKPKGTPQIPSAAQVPKLAPAAPAAGLAEQPRRFKLDLSIPTALAQPRSQPAAPALAYPPLLQPRTQRLREPLFSPNRELTGAGSNIRWERLALVQTATLGIKIGNDLTKDHTLVFDELLHFQGSYRITQAVSGIYNWAGVPPATADWIGAGTSALVMTALEYVDGRRLHDEASYSDLVANFAGIGFALAKSRVGFLQDFDLRFSYLTPADPFRHQTVKRYERMTHWLTYDLNRKFGLPLHLGFGYCSHKSLRRSRNRWSFCGSIISGIVCRFRHSAVQQQQGGDGSMNTIHGRQDMARARVEYCAPQRVP